jgi:hypothetical protein
MVQRLVISKLEIGGYVIVDWDRAETFYHAIFETEKQAAEFIRVWAVQAGATLESSKPI